MSASVRNGLAAGLRACARACSAPPCAYVGSGLRTRLREGAPAPERACQVRDRGRLSEPVSGPQGRAAPMASGWPRRRPESHDAGAALCPPSAARVVSSPARGRRWSWRWWRRPCAGDEAQTSGTAFPAQTTKQHLRCACRDPGHLLNRSSARECPL
ncbi:protein EOLA2 isoform X5 [Lutra lutra]|uniref:protein EOLA2 isoform X5 n=1 Tax=Lutra lutra TaxID=9657 RepID=UPI001FD539B0|nr:protein EOLA2 isoform X5 [Lutra lutra]